VNVVNPVASFDVDMSDEDFMQKFDQAVRERGIKDG